MPKHAVSVSLGSSSRDKTVEIELGGVEVRAERRGVDGDVKAFNRVMTELDGNVDVLSVGGTEIAFHVDDKIHDFRTEACITAAVGADKRLSIEEMNQAITELEIRPDVTSF